MNTWPDVGRGQGEPAGAGVGRPAQLEVLPGRLQRCAEDAERILSSLRAVQMLDWQSPAGRAYRDSIGRQCNALWLACHELQVAGTAVTRHAEAVTEQEVQGAVRWLN